MHQSFLGFLVLLLTLKYAFTGNILFLAATPSPSHHVWNKVLAYGLTNRGHNVTHITPDEDKRVKPENYTQIIFDGVYEAIRENFVFQDVGSHSLIKQLYKYGNYGIVNCEASLKSKGLKQLLDYPPNFKVDLIILDVTAGICMYPLIQRFKFPPTIAVTAFMLPPYVSYSFGNQMFPTFLPWYGLPYTSEMSFIERFWNFLFTYSDTLFRYIRQYNEEYKLIKTVFGDGIRSMKDFERHISLVLANTDPVLDYPQPLPPNIIAVGGLHTREAIQVSQDLQKVLDEAVNGIIVFSLGTNVRPETLDKKAQKSLLNAFSKIDKTVIWKFEGEIKNLPSNVIVRRWIPQSDILGHQNVKLFIGHGGALSTQEAIYHGVPMILIPFITDQFINTKLIVSKKLGISIDHQNITSQTILTQIQEVLNNKEYSQNVKTLSKRFKDRPETPLERGIFWTEYVMRHGGARFLSARIRDLPFYQATGLDVMAFLFSIVFTVLLSLYKCVRLTTILKSNKKKKVKTN